jgi:uncharacterized protein YndB with AHSA1/START domain
MTERSIVLADGGGDRRPNRRQLLTTSGAAAAGALLGLPASPVVAAPDEFEACLTSITVRIDAPIERVWAVLTDFPNSSWNPFCPRIESTLKVGDPIKLWVVNHQSSPEPFLITETVYAVAPPRFIQLQDSPAGVGQTLGHLSWGRGSRRDQFLVSREANSCFYYSTIFVFPSDSARAGRGSSNLSWVKEGFDRQARALKARAESLKA